MLSVHRPAAALLHFALILYLTAVKKGKAESCELPALNYLHIQLPVWGINLEIERTGSIRMLPAILVSLRVLMFICSILSNFPFKVIPAYQLAIVFASCYTNVKQSFYKKQVFVQHFLYMTGNDLRERLKSISTPSKKIVFSDIATALGMSRQDFNARFKAKRMDYDFIKRIAEVIDVPITTLTGFSAPIDESTQLEEPNQEYSMLTIQEKYLLSLEKNEQLHEKYEQSLEKHIVVQDMLIKSEQEKVTILKQWNAVQLKSAEQQTKQKSG